MPLNRGRTGVPAPTSPPHERRARRRLRASCPRGAAAAAAIAAFLALAAISPSPPRYTREQMEGALDESERWLLIHGTRDAAQAAVLRRRAVLVSGRLFGGDTSRVVADRDVTAEEIARRPVILFGGPVQNEWTLKLAPQLPVEFTRAGFRWAGLDYDRPGDVLHLVYPNPFDPHRFLLLVAGNSAAAIEREGAGFLFGAEDWRIYRDGELKRSGVFAQSGGRPWRYVSALDRDRDDEARRFTAALRAVRTARVTVWAPPGLALAAPALEQADTLLRQLDGIGLAVAADAPAAAPRRPRVRLSAPPPAKSGARPVSLTLYGSLEEKGTLTRDTRPEHLEEGGAHAALPAGRAALDLWSVAAARLVRLGASERSPFLHPASVALCGRLEGEPLARAVSRAYFGRALPSAREAASPGEGWRSPLVIVPARALLARAVFECGGARARAALLALLAGSPPGTLDSLCRVAGVSPPRVEARYRVLADSLARAGWNSPGRAPQVWRPSDGFQRGVCVAHAVSLDHGYLSADCARELETVRRLGANWISLTPFGYLTADGVPTIVPSAMGGAEEETDEAICEAGARARALGLRVWLKPHLWTRGWVGDLRYGPTGWRRFFDSYRVFVLHYALLAEREGFDGLVVGHELASSTLGFPDRWRGLIGEVRRVYHGTLTYDANWGDEIRGIAFWDALDLVSVSFYDPLAAKPTRSVAELAAGATKALDGLRGVAARTGRPLLISEVGYAPFAGAPVRPWEEHRSELDLETQRACYEAVVRALGPCDWVAGAFWWKWFSTDRIGGPTDASFTPRGKPAELVMSRAFREWQRRPVRVIVSATR